MKEVQVGVYHLYENSGKIWINKTINLARFTERNWELFKTENDAVMNTNPRRGVGRESFDSAVWDAFKINVGKELENG